MPFIVRDTASSSSNEAFDKRALIAIEPQLLGYSYAADTSSAGDNVQAAWRWADGQGVSVALLDDGFDLSQPGLFATLT